MWRFLCALTPILPLAAPAVAAAPPGLDPEIEQRWTEVEEATGWDIAALTLEPESLDVRAVFPRDLHAPGNDVEARASWVLAQMAALYEAPGSAFELVNVVALEPLSIARYRQSFAELPVYQAGATVIERSGGTVEAIFLNAMFEAPFDLAQQAHAFSGEVLLDARFGAPRLIGFETVENGRRGRDLLTSEILFEEEDFDRSECEYESTDEFCQNGAPEFVMDLLGRSIEVVLPGLNISATDSLSEVSLDGDEICFEYFSLLRGDAQGEGAGVDRSVQHEARVSGGRFEVPYVDSWDVADLKSDMRGKYFCIEEYPFSSGQDPWFRWHEDRVGFGNIMVLPIPSQITWSDDGFDPFPDPTSGTAPLAGASLDQRTAYGNLQTFYREIETTDPYFWSIYGKLSKPVRALVNSNHHPCGELGVDGFFSSRGRFDPDQPALHFCARTDPHEIGATAYHELYHYVTRKQVPESMASPSPFGEARSYAAECLFNSPATFCDPGYASAAVLEDYVYPSGRPRGTDPVANSAKAGKLVANRLMEAAGETSQDAVWRALHFAGYFTSNITEMCLSLRLMALGLDGDPDADRAICKALKRLNRPFSRIPLMDCQMPWDIEGDCIP